MSRKTDDLFSRLREILKQDRQYHEESYLFVLSALERVVRGLDKHRHISGGEFLKGIQREALEQFGPMAVTVLEHWGIKNSLDFGTIVFNMVRAGILLKTEADKIDDFADEAFFDRLSQACSVWKIETGKLLKEDQV